MSKIILPTFHPDQVNAFNVYRLHRNFVLRAGRRWGKTDFGITIAADGAAKGEPIGWFAPSYKLMAESYHTLSKILHPIKQQASLNEGVFRTTTGGRIDFWTLEDEDAGRSRKYKKAIFDEVAFTKSTMKNTWLRAIKPTLLDLRGRAIALSNTNGNDPENFMYQICNDAEFGFNEYHAPTHNNPYLPREDVDRLERDNHPLVYQQEYLAQFVDWSGVSFFSIDKMLYQGQPVSYPDICDTVFAVIDTATKTGTDNDATGVTYFATSENYGHPLIILDYDLIQIEGDSLSEWLPSVFRRLEELSGICRARGGAAGVWIEDQNSGTILIQRAAKVGWDNVHAINSDLTAKGKDGRSIAVSSYVYQGMVKLSEFVYNKVFTFKGVSRNHLISQVTGYRVGDKQAAKRSDDLLDTFTYGISLALGDYKGY